MITYTAPGPERGILILVLLTMLAGCMTQLEPPPLNWPNLNTLQPIRDLRVVPRELWQRRAIAYSGYRRGQNPQDNLLPSDDQVLEDLQLLINAGFGLIRTYGAEYHGEQVIRVIDENNLDIKVQLGAYVGKQFEDNGAANMLEVNKAIELANAYPEIIMAVSVGNEILVSWSFAAVPPREAIGYLQYVRARIEQPVTVNDNWEPYAAEAGSPLSRVWGQIDYASVHTYAYWDSGFEKWPFRQSDDAALIREAYRYSRDNFLAVRSALDSAGTRIPIVIGETGWQNIPSAREASALEPNFANLIAGAERQRAYFEAMQGWAYGDAWIDPGDGFDRPAAMFYFSAFDEPWKGADDNWGLWDADRQLKWEADVSR